MMKLEMMMMERERNSNSNSSSLSDVAIGYITINYYIQHRVRHDCECP